MLIVGSLGCMWISVWRCMLIISLMDMVGSLRCVLISVRQNLLSGPQGHTEERRWGNLCRGSHSEREGGPCAAGHQVGLRTWDESCRLPLLREDMERILKRYQGYDMNGREIKLIKDCDSSKSRSRSASRRAQSSRSRSKRNSRSRSGGSRSRQNSLSGRKPSRSLSRSRRRSISRSRSKSERSRSGKEKGRAKSKSERSSRSGSRHTLERGASGDEKRLDGVSLVEKA